MKRLTLAFFALLVQYSAYSQCNFVVSMDVPEADCGITSILVTGMADIGLCPDAVTYEYMWATSSFINGYNEITGELSQDTWSTSLEVTYEQQLTYLTFVVYAYDENGILLESSAIDYNINDHFPVSLPEMNIDFTCDNHCFQVDSIYLNDNVTFTLNGNPLSYYSLMSFTCLEEPGTYELAVTDQNGCFDSYTIEITEPISDINGSCETATILENGVIHNDELCAPAAGISDCTEYGYDASNWFIINSGDHTHLNIGVSTSNNYFDVYGIEVYQAVTEGDFSSLTSVNCFNPTEISTCFQVTTGLDGLDPNTNYYILIYGDLGLEYTISALLSYEPTSQCGCSDPNACNYNPNVWIGNYYCDYPGCTDISACNYSPWSGCDDGSCLYGTSLVGQLFHDVNGDGFWQNYGFFAEPALGNTGSIYIQELATTLYPNSQGIFIFPDLPLGTYTIEYLDDNDVWTLTTGSTFTLTLPTCYGAQIGLIPTSETLLQVSGPCCIWMMDIHCENGFNPGLWVENTGTVPLNGTFTMTFDPLFIPEYLTGAEPYDSYANGVMVWNIDNQMPGESILYQCHINGPGVDYMGQVFPYDMILVLVDDDGNVVYSESLLLEPEVVCSYDPNDKYAVPEGYTDQHFILDGDEIEYRIRFQNTGNAPAQDVIIEDQLDISTLDLSTFYPVFASHDFNTVVEADGHVRFIFNNIMLPDSASDEPGSQGYVLFRIKTLPDLPGGTEINNTAEIYFDSNPPIITNTTWHTIMDCDALGIPVTPEFCCANQECSFEADDQYLENLMWYVSGMNIGNGPSISYSFPDPGAFNLVLTSQNPLCEITQTADVYVYASPDPEIVLAGDVLSAGAGSSWQWYHDGAPIDGATSQTLSPEEYGFSEGVFWCLITNEFGCVTESNSLTYVSKNELTATQIMLYPNPAQDQLNLQLPDGYTEVRICNALGMEVHREQCRRPQSTLNIGHLAPGYYLLSAGNGDEVLTITFIKSE